MATREELLQEAIGDLDTKQKNSIETFSDVLIDIVRRYDTAKAALAYLPHSAFEQFTINYVDTEYKEGKSIVNLKLTAAYGIQEDAALLGTIAKTEQLLRKDGYPADREITVAYAKGRINAIVRTKIRGQAFAYVFQALTPGDNCRLVTEEVEVPARMESRTKLVCDETN